MAGGSMKTAIGFALVGFTAGIAVALALTQIGNARPLSPQELHVLWPAASLGLDFTDWSDGNSWDFLRLLLIYLGNGVVYAVFAAAFGALVEFLSGTSRGTARRPPKATQTSRSVAARPRSS